MEFVVALLTLSSLFLTATVYLVQRMTKSLNYQSHNLLKSAELQSEAVLHLSNLLASKDALTFQQLQAVTVAPVYPEETGYTGLYKTGEELELEEAERKLAAVFDTYN